MVMRVVIHIALLPYAKEDRGAVCPLAKDNHKDWFYASARKVGNVLGFPYQWDDGNAVE